MQIANESLGKVTTETLPRPQESACSIYQTLSAKSLLAITLPLPQTIKQCHVEHDLAGARTSKHELSLAIYCLILFKTARFNLKKYNQTK